MVLRKLRAKIKRVVQKVTKKKETKPTPTSKVPSPTPLKPSIVTQPKGASAQSFPPPRKSFPPPTQSFPPPRQSFPPPKPGVVTIKGKTISTVEKVQIPKTKTQQALQIISRKKSIIRTKQLRSKKLKLGREIRLAGLTFAGSVIGALEGIRQLPRTTVNLIKSPGNIKRIPKEIKKGGVQFGQLLRVSPTEALVKVGAEIFILKGTGKLIQVTGKVTQNTFTRLSPKFKGVNPKIIKFKSGTGGTTTIKVGGTVKKLSEPLKKQIKLAGKKVTGVSAQADRLVNLIKTKRVIRKPIPNEANLPISIKKLLRKFDKGKINKRSFLILEKSLNQRGQSLLERSFFADPRARFRPSRLGLRQKEASLLDILTGDFTFKSSRPQILVFEKTVIEKLPKTKKFKIIKSKLEKGKTLTPTESKELLRFQTKVTGKFKPIGALTKEPEITLAQGELIKREKVVGRVIIQGKSVPIVRVKVVKATSLTKKLLSKAKKGKIKTKEIKILERRLKKETGFKPRLSRRRTGKRIIRARPLFRGARKPRRPRRRRIVRKPRRPTRRGRRLRRISRPSRTSRGRFTRRRRIIPTTRRATPSPRGSFAPSSRLPFRPVPKSSKARTRRGKIRRKGFNVFARPLKRKKGQKRSKLIRINKVPLKKRRAKDLRNFVIDHSLSRTGRIKPTKAKAKKPVLKVPQGFSKKTSVKFRRFKQVKGKRVKLPKGKVIERGRRLLDTRSEKRGITLRRKVAQLERESKKKSKRKTTSKLSANQIRMAKVRSFKRR